MKKVVSISLGPSSRDYEFKTTFLGQNFHIQRFGTDLDEDKAFELLSKWNDEADVIGLGMVKDHYTIGKRKFIQKNTKQLENAVTRIPVTTGATLREILQEWSLRHAQIKLGDYFNNAKVLFLSGMTNYKIATVMAEYTDSIAFADPVYQLGIPKLLSSLKELEKYTTGIHKIMEWKPERTLIPTVSPLEKWKNKIIRKAMLNATIVVGLFHEIDKFGIEELAGKTILSSTISSDKLAVLKERGIDMIVDGSPHIFERVVGRNVLEAMIIAALEKSPKDITQDDYLEIITSLGMEPKIIYPSKFKRVNRFAFIIHPLSLEYFKTIKPVDILSKHSPPFFLKTVEKLMAYAPPFVYSKVTGIKSPTGVEAEGWLISVGGTPKEVLSCSPEYTYRRLLAGAQIAKKLGAQILGLGAFTTVVGDAGITIAKRSPLPLTTGNNYSVSCALWAASDAIKRLGFVKMDEDNKIQGKAMVLGATGTIGSVYARLLANAADEVYLVSAETAKLLALKESIEKETPDTTLRLAFEPEKNLKNMDIIVMASSAAGKFSFDIMKVKPGCVIIDVMRPLNLDPTEVARRPDILVIDSGEIELPGKVKMKNIGLPSNMAYACLAETIILALEGRFENFSSGREIKWDKVKEIFKLGLKHGMRLAAISGVNGVFTQSEIKKVRELAIEATKNQ